MRLTWIGHSCFLAEGAAADGATARVLMDPYASPGCGAYAPVDVAADVVTISHSYDAVWHGDLTHVQGDPVVLADLYGDHADAAGVRFESIKTHHTDARTRPNTTLWFTLGGVRVCHLGDLGHALTDAEAARIRPVDVVLAPVSGVYIIEPEDLLPVLRGLDPKVVVPMHYKNDKIDLGMRPLGDFLELVAQGPAWPVDRPGASAVELSPKMLPAETRVVALEPAR